MEIITKSNLAVDEKKVVFITHDESTFYCCEGKKVMWMENGKMKILSKTNGTSMMVSGFVCSCHGFMRNASKQSFQLFEAGKNREGWFTNAHLVEQFNDIIDLIEELHPGNDITVAFDNSMTHHAKSPDGLDVSVLKLSDGMSSKTKVPMKPGWFINEAGEKVVQQMQDEKGIQKGVSVASLGSRHGEREGWEREQGKGGWKSYCYGNNVVSLQINTAGIMAMNRVDRIVLDPNRTYACTRTARTGVRVT